MIGESRLAVVVPCFNEGKQLAKVIDTMPATVDRIYVVNDCSSDDTLKIANDFAANDDRIKVIDHEVNQGVGGAIASGYMAARDEAFDVTVVMAGDAQMDPAELPDIAGPVARDECDYTKGNRLFSGQAWKIIPRARYLGNSLMSLLTKIASGYWHIADSQSGYTGINLKALQTIDWDSMYKRYGQPNDLLVKLNIYDFRVRDVPIRPVYDVGEESGVKPFRMIPRLSWLLFRLFVQRMIQKYVIRDFHPLVLFYLFGLVFLLFGLALGAYLLIYRIFIGPVADTSAIFAAMFFITGTQLSLFAMWFDMESNKHLR